MSNVARRFAAAMERFGPFEPAPELAVAVSGGPDSMALAVLADRWARRRRGRVVALVVDHGLRPGSRAEARLTRKRLAALGIESRLLVWRGEKPKTGIQAAARKARYGLLEAWCARAGILHLLTGHQRDDQAETVAMRRARRSGSEGLAGIAPIMEREHVRVLRPLLNVRRAALQRFLRERAIAWIDDPSNSNPAFARTGIRAALSTGPGADRRIAELVRTARAAASARARIDSACARLLARNAAVLPQGFARIPRAALATAPLSVASRSLARLLACIGGGSWLPGAAACDSLLADIRQPGPLRGRTLAGCRIIAERSGALLIVREVRGAARPRKPEPGQTWDGRFRFVVRSTRESYLPPVASLGQSGWVQAVRREPSLRNSAIPQAARSALPAFWRAGRLIAVPHLAYGRPSRKAASLSNDRVIFRPAHVLCPAEFPVV